MVERGAGRAARAAAADRVSVRAALPGRGDRYAGRGALTGGVSPAPGSSHEVARRYLEGSASGEKSAIVSHDPIGVFHGKRPLVWFATRQARRPPAGSAGRTPRKRWVHGYAPAFPFPPCARGAATRSPIAHAAAWAASGSALPPPSLTPNDAGSIWAVPAAGGCPAGSRRPRRPRDGSAARTAGTGSRCPRRGTPRGSRNAARW